MILSLNSRELLLIQTLTDSVAQQSSRNTILMQKLFSHAALIRSGSMDEHIDSETAIVDLPFSWQLWLVS